MLLRRARAGARGDDWGCCPYKPVRPVEPANEAYVPGKNSQPANDVPREPYSSTPAPLWNVSVGGDNNASDAAVTAAVGWNLAGDRQRGTCAAPVYAAVASSVVVAALIVALVAAVICRQRRRRRGSAGGGGNAAGHAGGQWNKKKLSGVLQTPAHCDLHQQQRTPKAGYNSPELQANTGGGSAAAVSSVSSSSSSKRPSTGNQRHGYTPLPGAVYPATGCARPRRDANPYGLPPSQCSYQPQRVKFVTVHRTPTLDSEASDVYNGERRPSQHAAVSDNNDDDVRAASDLQTLLPLNSLRSLFGVVSGVFGIAPSFTGGTHQPPAVTDRRTSTATPATVARASVSAGPTVSITSPAVACFTGERVNGGKAAAAAAAHCVASSELPRQRQQLSRDMGSNTSAAATAAEEPPLTSVTDIPTGATTTTPCAPPAQSNSNDLESIGSADALDRVHTAASMLTMASSTATQSAAASGGDLDAVLAGSDDAASLSAQSLRQSAAAAAEKWSVDSTSSTPEAAAANSRQSSTTLQGRIGGLADALGISGLMRSMTTGGHPEQTNRVEPFWVPPGLQVQKRRAQSLQSSLPLSQFDATNTNAKNGKAQLHNIAVC